MIVMFFEDRVEYKTFCLVSGLIMGYYDDKYLKVLRKTAGQIAV